MEKEISIFKDKVGQIIDEKSMKLWLTKRIGKRVEYLFKVGEEQFSNPQKIAVNDDYILFGQKIDKELATELELLFNTYFN